MTKSWRNSLRRILLPFSFLYGLVSATRNLLFDLGWLDSYKIRQKSITVGNLSTGGTGKTPHVLYLEKKLSGTHKVAIISRGYGRKTKGFLVATSEHSASDIGDEPMLLMENKAKETQILLSEERLTAVHYVENNFPESFLLLDDAFQHRWVKANKQILLTSFHQPFTKDYLLPAGNLREKKSEAKRADIIVVTKTPNNATEAQKNRLSEGLKKYGKPLFFSSFKYGNPIAINNESLLEDPEKILLVTGIADTHPLLNHLKHRFPHAQLQSVNFPDHHDFTATDLGDIHDKFNKFAPSRGIILSTEKDEVKIRHLRHLKPEWVTLPWFIQRIEVHIENEEEFLELIKK